MTGSSKLFLRLSNGVTALADNGNVVIGLILSENPEIYCE